MIIDPQFSKKNVLTKLCNSINNFRYTNNNIEKLCLSFYNFRTKNSTDIKIKLLNISEELIDRKKTVNRLNYVIDNIVISTEVERGIFEFSLIYVINNKLPYHFIEDIYCSKVEELIDNLDPKNKHIKNTDFLPFIKSKDFDCYFAAFLSPMQMFPSNWVDIAESIKQKDAALYERKTTDKYKCSRCKQRKFYVMEMQMRSADEPSNFFYTCAVCCKTFIK